MTLYTVVEAGTRRQHSDVTDAIIFALRIVMEQAMSGLRADRLVLRTRDALGAEPQDDEQYQVTAMPGPLGRLPVISISNLQR